MQEFTIQFQGIEYIFPKTPSFIINLKFSIQKFVDNSMLSIIILFYM